MKKLTIAFVTMLAGSLCIAQGGKPGIIEDFKPSTLNQPGQEYPQVNSQGYACSRKSSTHDCCNR